MLNVKKQREIEKRNSVNSYLLLLHVNKGKTSCMSGYTIYLRAHSLNTTEKKLSISINKSRICWR